MIYSSFKPIPQVLHRAIPIFETRYPGCVAVFLFDNSTNHGCMAEDALLASKMNLKDGGKNQVARRTTTWIANGVVHEQQMVHPDGTAKGLRTVLEERGLRSAGLKRTCYRSDDSPPFSEGDPCCATCLLAFQPDFLNQKSRLVEEIEKRGHKAVFYPKFHCELNFIEYFWGAAKRYARENCEYSFKGLRQTIPRALASVKPLTIRKFSLISRRYMQGYRNGMTGVELDQAVKKYKSHRRVSQLFSTIDNPVTSSTSILDK